MVRHVLSLLPKTAQGLAAAAFRTAFMQQTEVRREFRVVKTR